MEDNRDIVVSIADKKYWTLEEAASMTNIGMAKLREISNSRNCNFVLFVGRKRLFKKDKLLAYLDNEYSI